MQDIQLHAFMQASPIRGAPRFLLVRVESPGWLYGRGWKISLALHRKLFYWCKGYKQLRATLLGLSFYWRCH